VGDGVAVWVCLDCAYVKDLQAVGRREELFNSL